MPVPGAAAPTQTMHRILIVDDDAGQRSLLQSFLSGQGFATQTAASGEGALALLAGNEFDLMISDVRMPGISGLETLRRARKSHAVLPVLLVTAYADVREAVGAMRDGAVNYLTKPIDLDELLGSVRQTLGLAGDQPIFLDASFRLPENIIARSPGMQAVLRDAALIAPSESRVLLTGESGTGKEVLSDLIHAWSARSSGPIVKVNCAAIPENLLESELFGHERGAFSGATHSRVGRFEVASGGTLLLDEISEMSPHLQAKLLRVTQDGRFQRLGSNQEIQTQTRILAASNRHLEEEVRAGRFREDLFYRLSVVELHLPPLRERREDILPLAGHFVQTFSDGRARLAASASDILERYTWPGNVRELRNAMERAVLLSRSELILPEHLPGRVREGPVVSPPPTPPAPTPSGPAKPSPQAEGRLEDIERDAIIQALQAHRFNRSETARALGISRRALLYKLQRLRELGYPIDG